MSKGVIFLVGLVVGAGGVLWLQAVWPSVEAEAFRIEASLEACEAELAKYEAGYCKVDDFGQVHIIITKY